MIRYPALDLTQVRAVITDVSRDERQAARVHEISALPGSVQIVDDTSWASKNTLTFVKTNPIIFGWKGLQSQ